MRRVVCVLLLMAALPASARAAADPLVVKGGRFVDGHGRAVVLHGVNVVYKLAPYTPDFTRADARRLHGWSMNAIRLGVSWRALEPARGAIDAAYVARWSYRAGDGRFTLRWTSARGADTVVAVPRVAYPRGFSVRAHGVRVVRRAPLTLRGAGRASITITRR
jgi:hypothetical protein